MCHTVVISHFSTKNERDRRQSFTNQTAVMIRSALRSETPPFRQKAEKHTKSK